MITAKKQGRQSATPASFSDYSNPPMFTNKGANTTATIVINLIKILIDGPEVSLNGSPTVSPTTAAL